jgi:hypothetical protein
MKNLLKYLFTWKTIKLFLNIVYYVGFFFWFLAKMMYLTFNDNYLINNNDIFIALFFITFFLLDIKDALNYYKTKD